MKREKSCGAVVYRYNNDVLEVLLIRHRFGGHWSFPKGHVEEGENEFQTALREVKEETNLSIRLREGFRESVEYFPKPYIKKQVVISKIGNLFFIAKSRQTQSCLYGIVIVFSEHKNMKPVAFENLFFQFITRQL